jgi:hybrid cluster-associated redox disulfide protein
MPWADAPRLRQRNDIALPSGAGFAPGAGWPGAPVIMQRPDFDDPDLPLQMLFRHWPETSAVFLSHRMLCFGCPITPFHTVTDACAEYGLDETAFRTELRAALPTPAPR